jgi:hypothetical protein
MVRVGQRYHQGMAIPPDSPSSHGRTLSCLEGQRITVRRAFRPYHIADA